jgi:oligo-1,6-glucosidase
MNQEVVARAAIREAPTSGVGEPWWKSAVVYQIYPRSFADSTGDGIGDLRGIIDHVDHLVALGIDVVWLSPIYASPQDDNGYDISDYQSVDPTFGTLDDLDELIDVLHARDIRLVMDLVVNHTSDEHPWFSESRSSRDNPKRDWYWWRPPCPGHDPAEPGAEPTNWASFFGGSTWEWDPDSEEYYLHLFSRRQPDLNWENPQVREAVYAMMRWWLDRGVDGFRMDVINLISKDPQLPDGVVPARAEVDMVFQFEHVGLDHGPGGKWDPIPLTVSALKDNTRRWQAALADVGWNSLYWNNHDQPRAVSRFGNDTAFRELSAKLLGTVLHLQRGTPYVYQGEELGMTNTPFAAPDDFRDIESINEFIDATTRRGLRPDVVLAAMGRASRDNARTPMQWDAGPQAGFTTGAPWIAANPNHVAINAAGQVGRPGSVFEHYRQLIELRHSEPAVVHGDFTMLLAEHPTLFCYTRSFNGTELLVLANMADTVATASGAFAEWAAAEVLLPNYPDGFAGLDGATVTLRPWEAAVLRRHER